MTLGRAPCDRPLASGWSRPPRLGLPTLAGLRRRSPRPLGRRELTPSCQVRIRALSLIGAAAEEAEDDEVVEDAEGDDEDIVKDAEEDDEDIVEDDKSETSQSEGKEESSIASDWRHGQVRRCIAAPAAGSCGQNVATFRSWGVFV